MIGRSRLFPFAVPLGIVLLALLLTLAIPTASLRSSSPGTIVAPYLGGQTNLVLPAIQAGPSRLSLLPAYALFRHEMGLVH
jgi:hypothetical protein